MVLTTSTGSEAKILHTEIWDNEPITTENDQPISNSSYADWYETFTAMGRRLVGEIKQKPSSHAYLGEQINEKWGSIHVFQKNEIVQASDVLSSLPLIITYKIHTNDFRWIEMKQEVRKKEQVIDFRLWRLAAWDELEANKLPLDIFTHTFRDENDHGYQ